ncbi:CinA family nicotinamide mononucleotide deamidase-related protein [Aliagarivorans taiwanensis]|uniref:CinA family nicotinamide mononucleotide deamidase-related protein n=1 Tax=Aliagarivorans taiwanensis TaxID=561966 RepID=UPI0003F98795|nr:CinA family nicotinamide mononucleotide deamidase-related protein [Aliagarivorans taiwanensis]
MLKIEMLSTGDEVLQGDILDSNAGWLGQQLAECGLKFSRRQTVADDLVDIIDAMDQAAKRADWVIVNGGLGPTSDDLSAAAAAKLVGKPLVCFDDWLDKLQGWYDAQGKSMPQSNVKQAMLPEGAELVDNPIGTACGFVVGHHGARLLFTPGVPSEFKRMLSDYWFPLLSAYQQQEQQQQQGQQLGVKRFYTFGLSESSLSDRLDSMALPQGMRLGYRSARPTIEVKLFGDTNQPEFATTAQQLAEELGSHVFSEDRGDWSKYLGELLIAAKAKLALAESCTGGLIASELVAIPGSSAYLERGFVTYSNQAKMECLGVDEALLESFGAVSIEVAQAMAKGALTNSGADIALSVTGVAGPGGGSDEKPVGTVCFALATPDQCFSQRLKLAGRSRSAVRLVSAYVALDMLRRYLTGQEVCAVYDSMQTVDRQQSH